MAVPSPQTTCPRCSGAMESGVLVDSTHGHGSGIMRGPERVLEWLRGTPKKSWFGFKADGADRIQVTTLRCKACGFLDLYAVTKE